MPDDHIVPESVVFVRVGDHDRTGQHGHYICVPVAHKIDPVVNGASAFPELRRDQLNLLHRQNDRCSIDLIRIGFHRIKKIIVAVFELFDCLQISGQLICKQFDRMG